MQGLDEYHAIGRGKLDPVETRRWLVPPSNAAGQPLRNTWFNIQ